MEPTQNNPNNHNLIIIQKLDEFKNDIINIIDNKNNKLNNKIKNFTYKINNRINNNQNNKRLAKSQIINHSKLIEDSNQNNNIKWNKNLYSESPKKNIENENSDSNEDFDQNTEKEKNKNYKNLKRGKYKKKLKKQNLK